MPLPGPRTQTGPLAGYGNPGHEQSDRFNRWDRPAPVAQAGRTPATMVVSTRRNVLAPGTVRRLWRPVADMIAAQAPYSWTESAPAPGRPVVASRGLGITSSLRYMARSLYVAAGTDASRSTGLHTKIHPRVQSKPVSINAGQVRSRPTVRNRLTSFGSRVPPLNAKVPASND